LHSYTYQYVNELGVILKPVSPILYFTYPSDRHPKLCIPGQSPASLRWKEWPAPLCVSTSFCLPGQ